MFICISKIYNISAAILFQGMRIVQGPEEFVESFLGAKREAAASFGIDTILLEKYITQPRHVEVQVKSFRIVNLA